MRGDQVQIFISYARRDDTPTGKAGSLGFIAALREQLGHILEKQGYPEPHVWRDKEQIEGGDYFDPVIEKAIANSELMVVVLSRNWINRPNCRKELELFQHRWQGMKERVIVVRRNWVDEEEVPELLRGTEGFRFYRFRDPRQPVAGSEIYFDRDTATEDEFCRVADELGGYLWRAAKHRRSLSSARVTTEPVASGRTVYLAKPAPDMTASYEFLANNLENDGFKVVPPRGQMIPLDSLAERFVDDELAQADTSIHLLGEEAGYAPSGQDPIARMQLSRARARADGADKTSPAFRQVIWAPKLLDGGAKFRDPAVVLKNFGSGIEGYKLLGDVQSSFWISLRQLLNRPGMHGAAEQPVQPHDPDSRIYIYHRKEDRGFALDIVKVLKNQDPNTNIVLPATQGTDVERSEYHKEELRSCDTVLLCWARAPDVWARMQLNELRSWQRLGRTNKFRIRGLVLGPPPDETKERDVLPPKSDYDRLLDFINEEHPNPEALGALLTGAPLAHP
jgi:TIR domain-containing protein